MAGLAGVISSLDGDADFVPFFIGLTFLGGVAAWAAHAPFEGARRRIAQIASAIWLIAAVWAGVLLLMAATVWQASSPPPSPEDTHLGLTATVYHAVGLFGGAVLMLVVGFAPDRWFAGAGPTSATDPAREPI